MSSGNNKRSKMKKFLKWFFIITAGVIVLLTIILSILWIGYTRKYSMKTATGFEINNPDLDKKILIGTQGSEYKDALVKKLTDVLKEREVYIKVIDDLILKQTNPDDWDVAILIHTTEMWKIAEGARDFLKRSKDLNKVILITTSGEGDWKQEEFEVEAITSASEMSDIDSIVEKTIKKTDKILNK